MPDSGTFELVGLGRAERPQNLPYGQNAHYNQNNQTSLAHLLQNPQFAQLRQQANQLNQQAPSNPFPGNAYNFNQISMANTWIFYPSICAHKLFCLPYPDHMTDKIEACLTTCRVHVLAELLSSCSHLFVCCFPFTGQLS